jgi:multiple sugar transport system ATP-binding protein
VFLLDEPLSNLDARLRAAMRVEIARLHRRLGATMVYVTHDQVEAMTLGERIVVLDGGRIRQVDTPMALYERPADVFVATFLGSPAMNMMPGRLDVEGAAFAADDGTRVPLPGLQVPDAWSGRPLLLGVRPEHLLREDEAVPASGAFEARVEVVEPVGNEVFVNLWVGGNALVARLPPGPLPRPGASLRLRLDVPRVHLFDGTRGSEGARLERAGTE